LGNFNKNRKPKIIKDKEEKEKDIEEEEKD